MIFFKRKPKIKACGLTDKGKVREKNEDCILMNSLIGLYMVADGMGGHSCGDVASRMAVTIINEYLEKALSKESQNRSAQEEDFSTLILEAITLANQAIYNFSQDLPGKDIIGTTLSLLLIKDQKIFLAHIGDSRIYRIRNRILEKLTTDHTQVQELVDMGRISEEEADKHPLSHVLTRALGSHEVVKPDFQIISLEKRDGFLLTTDGLLRVLSLNYVQEILFSPMDKESKCRSLMDMALDGGAPDNVSIIIIEQS